MNNLVKGLCGVLAGTLLWGMSAFAAEVTPFDAVLYSNEYAALYAEPDLDSDVAVTSEVFPDGIPVLVTGVTDNGFYQVSVEGTWYLPGIGLTVETAADDTAAADDTVTTDETEAAEQAAQDAAAAEQAETSGTVDILMQYILRDSTSAVRLLVVQNNTSRTVDIGTASTAYASDGVTVLGTDEEAVLAVGPGCVTMIKETYDTNAMSSFSTELMYAESAYTSVLENLAYSIQITEDGAEVRVTNTGSEAADLVTGYAVFFQEESLVNYRWTYFMDENAELPAGETMTVTFPSSVSYDSVLFYLSGFGL